MAETVNNAGKRLTAMTKFLGKCLGYIVVASTQTNFRCCSELLFTRFGEMCISRKSRSFVNIFNKTVKFAK